jgi:hypothetical protein
LIVTGIGNTTRASPVTIIIISITAIALAIAELVEICNKGGQR